MLRHDEHGIRLDKKIRVYRVVLPMLSYGSDSWDPYRYHIRQLNVFHKRHLRAIFGVNLQDNASKLELLNGVILEESRFSS